MALRPCLRPGCAAAVARGYCDACAKYSSRARGQAARVRLESKRWYDSPRWRKYRLSYLAKHPFCADPFKVHGEWVVPAEHLDHVVAHKEDWDSFWNGEKQGLCASCHSRKTATEDGGFGRKGNAINTWVGVGQISAAPGR